MSFISSIAGSVARGGFLKTAGKTAVRGLKSSGGRIAKGLKRTGVHVIRGIKSASAQAKALPKALSDARQLFKNLPDNFSRENARIVIENSIKNDLKTARNLVLMKDARERLSQTFAKIVSDRNLRKSFKKLLKNAKKNETWGNYARRMGRGAGNLVRNVIREGGENIVIDQSAQSIAKAIGGLTSAGVAGAVTAKLTEKKD